MRALLIILSDEVIHEERLLNLNKTWVQKQGDFFVESPIILFAAIILWHLLYKLVGVVTHLGNLLPQGYEIAKHRGLVYGVAQQGGGVVGAHK